MLLFPNAKINLGLYVVRRREDGYHDLETVFYPVPLADTLETKPLRGSNKPYAFQAVGLPIDGNADDNLILRVLRDVQKDFDVPALDVYLDKHIPMGAGLGGGSSDAAAMLRGLNEDFSLGMTDEEMEVRVSRYGADCAFFIRQRPVFATGIGDQMTPIPLSLKGWTLVLVKPQVSVPTRDAYAGIVPQAASCHLPDALQQPVETWRDSVSNDFERPVFSKYPQIAALKETLYDMGAAYASMSGSGSTVFGLFRTPPPSVAEVFDDCFTYRSLLRL